MPLVYPYMNPERVFFLDATTREDAIRTMVDLLAANDTLKDPEQFLDAIKQREKIVTTGIGMAVAIPHAKLSDIDDFFIAIGIVDKGVEWNSLDGKPVRVIFMIGGPDDKQTEYLRLLSGLTLALKDEERRKKILLAKTPESIVELFKGY